MAPERQKLESALHSLRLQFVQNLAAEVAKVDAQLLRWQAGDEAALGAAISLAHGLAGAGSLFGRRDVTLAARALEQLLCTLPDDWQLQLPAARAALLKLGQMATE
ncbi:Hpt domain-containing protein [Chitinimonas prasina]|nr:Hpt domain-containing protein [Chitinimonas prasina]